MELIKCAGCGKERAKNEMKQGIIIARGRKWDYRKNKNIACVIEKKNYYCADGPCHAHDQMAHEG